MCGFVICYFTNKLHTIFTRRAKYHQKPQTKDLWRNSSTALSTTLQHYIAGWSLETCAHNQFWNTIENKKRRRFVYFYCCAVRVHAGFILICICFSKYTNLVLFFIFWFDVSWNIRQLVIKLYTSYKHARINR